MKAGILTSIFVTIIFISFTADPFTQNTKFELRSYHIELLVIRTINGYNLSMNFVLRKSRSNLKLEISATIGSEDNWS